MMISFLRIWNYFLDLFLAFWCFVALGTGSCDYWTYIPKKCGPDTQKQYNLERPPNPKHLQTPSPRPCASKPGAFVGLETSNLPRPKTFMSVYGLALRFRLRIVLSFCTKNDIKENSMPYASSGVYI